MFELPEQNPYTINWEPIYLPAILTFFGLILWVGGRLYEVRENKKMPLKWVGLGLIIFACVYGLRWPIYLQDVVYGAAMGWRKRIIHWAAFLGPLLVAIASFVWYQVDLRNKSVR